TAYGQNLAQRVTNATHRQPLCNRTQPVRTGTPDDRPRGAHPHHQVLHGLERRSYSQALRHLLPGLRTRLRQAPARQIAAPGVALREEPAEPAGGDDADRALLRKPAATDRTVQQDPRVLASAGRRVRAPRLPRLRNLPAVASFSAAELRVGVEPVADHFAERRVVPRCLRMPERLRAGCLRPRSQGMPELRDLAAP